MKIGIVLVTFNRIEKLKRAIKSIEMQECKKGIINFLVIVNNNSTDGTKEWLNEWKNKIGYFKKNCYK